MAGDGGGQPERPAGLKGRARTIARNFTFLTGGRLLGEFFTFLLFVVLSREFGQTGIGQYSFAVAFTGFFAVVSEFGLYHWAIKEFSRDDGDVGRLYGPMMTLRLLLFGLVLAALLAPLPFLPLPHETRLVVVSVGIYQLLIRMLGAVTAVFLARHDPRSAGLLDAALKAIAAIAVMAIVFAGGGIVLALSVLPVVGAAVLIAAWCLMSSRYGRPRLGVTRPMLTGTFRAALPYGLSRIFYQLYMRTDVVVISFMIGEAAAGVYNVAYRVVFLFMFIPQFASLALFPVASRLHREAAGELRELYHRSIGLMVLIALPAAAGLALVAPEIIGLVFGAEFTDSAPLLRILTGLLLLNFVSASMDVFMVACDLQVVRTKCQGVVAALNVTGNLALIPIFGLTGAACTTLASEAVLVVLFGFRLRRELGTPRVLSRLLIAATGVATFTVPVALFPALPVVVALPVFALLYAGVLLLFRETRSNEVRLLLSLARGGGAVR